MHGAGTGHGQQYPLPVLVQHARCGHRIQFGEWVAAISRRDNEFVSQRQDLPQQRVVGIPRAHARHETTRYPQPESGAGLQGGG